MQSFNATLNRKIMDATVNRLRSENCQISTRMNFAQIIQKVTRIDHEVTNFRIQNQFCKFCFGKNVAGRLPEAFRVCSSDSLVNFEHLSDRFGFFNLELNLFIQFHRVSHSKIFWEMEIVSVPNFHHNFSHQSVIFHKRLISHTISVPVFVFNYRLDTETFHFPSKI